MGSGVEPREERFQEEGFTVIGALETLEGLKEEILGFCTKVHRRLLKEPSEGRIQVAGGEEAENAVIVLALQEELICLCSWTINMCDLLGNTLKS